MRTKQRAVSYFRSFVVFIDEATCLFYSENLIFQLIFKYFQRFKVCKRLFILLFSVNMMQYMLLFSRQGKLRLQKWYTAYPDKVSVFPIHMCNFTLNFQQKKKICRELITQILARKPKMCAFLEYKDLKVVYKRFVFYIQK